MSISPRSDIRKALDCLDKLFQTKDRLDASFGSSDFYGEMVKGFEKAIENRASALSETAQALDSNCGDEEMIGFINRAMDIMETASNAGIETEGINTAILAMLECF